MLDDFTIERGIQLAVLGAALLIPGLLLLWRRPGGGSHEASSELPDLPDLTRGPRRLAFGILVLFVGLGGGWSVLAPLASAAIAPGVVSPEGARRSVQHFEGGIIDEVHVTDGDRVARGDPLITLEDVRAKADHTVLRERYLHLRARVARLEAEHALAEKVALPDELQPVRLSSSARDVVAAQLELFENRRHTLEARREVLDQRVLQLEEENAGLREAIAGQNRQMELVEREIAGVEKLYDKGLERLPRLLELRRTQAQIRIDRAQNRARIARNLQAIGETRIEKASLEDDWRERAGDELAEARAELAEAKSRLPKTEDALTRTVVRAPLAGTIVELAFTTVGGVVKPGERIVDIVPAEADLLIDARVRPQDIEDVHTGLEAKVILSAYTQRTMPTITGRVETVSADRITEERSNDAYYLARVEVDREQLIDLGDHVELVPGMPAEVMIRTGERTFFDYLVTPLVQSFNRSFRES